MIKINSNIGYSMKILVVATSKKTKGGISSVIRVYQEEEFWKNYKCRWVESSIDKSYIHKFIYFIQAFTLMIMIVPFYDIVHFHVSEPVSAVRKAFLVIIARIYRKKIIIHFHAFSAETTFRSRYSVVYRFLVACADEVLVLSDYWKRELLASLRVDCPVSILFNPCANTRNVEVSERSNRILYAGALVPRKGYADLIRAFAVIVPKYKDWTLVMAGDGETGKAILLAEQLGILDRVEFPGWIAGARKDEIFSHASIFCLPSYAEGFPMAVLDAWAYGLPVVTTSINGIDEIVHNNVNGLLFPPGDIHSLSKCLESLMESKPLRETLAAKSIEESHNTFSARNITQKLGQIYEGLLRRKVRSSFSGQQ
jgi:glycosyltransferase involved in cell wall biosynthesis